MTVTTCNPAYTEAEYEYRFQERLGILCGSATPTQDQIAIAKAEADEWVAVQPPPTPPQ